MFYRGKEVENRVELQPGEKPRTDKYGLTGSLFFAHRATDWESAKLTPRTRNELESVAVLSHILYSPSVKNGGLSLWVTLDGTELEFYRVPKVAMTSFLSV